MSFYIPEGQKSEKGKYYYCVTCPNSGDLLVIEEDESEGAKRFPANELLISCHHCQTNHLFDSSEVRSLPVAEGE
jgi:hypothetical protein